MADDKSKQVQKTNQNGRPTLVLKTEHLEKTAELAETTSDLLGHTTAGTNVFNDHNINWGIFHSNTTPLISLERLKQIKNIRISRSNPETTHVSNSNSHSRGTSIRSINNAADDVASKLSKVNTAIEGLVAVKEKDAKALAKTSSVVMVSTAGDMVGAKVVGKCIELAARKIEPKRMAIAGAACIAAWQYGISDSIEQMGEKLGEKKQSVNTAAAIINAIDKLDQQEKVAEEKRRQREIEKEPMREWQIQSSD